MKQAIFNKLPKVSNLIIIENNGQLHLNWAPLKDAEHYQVYVATAAFTKASAATEFKVKGTDYCYQPSADGIYYARVAAVKGAAVSELSDIALIEHATGPQTQKATWQGKAYSVELDASAHERCYHFRTDEAIRYADQVSYGNGRRDIAEDTSQLYSRTGNFMFDGLLALAMTEVKENSVETISDDAFADAACSCFQTGRKWKYVWTRDTAYSVDLAMAAIDPLRSMHSLDFKLSTGRKDNNWEIVQDTGTGGSWPISSDRVTWAMGCKQTLNYLMEPERSSFRDKSYLALKNTIARDRLAVFDPRDGLYRGEQSFLDWREQTYPSWTAGNGTVHIGMSKTLSTNVAHYQALSLAAELATEKGEGLAANHYQQMADALKKAINDELWLEDVGMYSTMKTTEFAPATTHKYDALGEALTIISGVANKTQAQQIIQNYPHSQAGVPVIWPQQAETFVYHNRAIWPFVSAYLLKAAVIANNEAVVDHNIDSLMRGAALNLSNMENFEFLSHNNLETSLNSQRQLWSVAAYVTMVQDVIFGQQADSQGIRFKPYITAYMRNTLFNKQSLIQLNNINYRGKKIHLQLVLPAPSKEAQGVYSISTISLNAEPQQGCITRAQLHTENIVRITLGALQCSQTLMTKRADPQDYQALYAPKEPRLEELTLEGGQIKLNFNNQGETGTDFNIFRNGKKVAKDLPGNSRTWIDKQSTEHTSYCYSLEQVFRHSGHASHRSEPQCYWANEAVSCFTPSHGLQSLDAASTSQEHGRLHFNDWGGAKQTLQAEFSAKASGQHYLQTTYGNSFNIIETGITASVKLITVQGDDGSQQKGVVFMPQLNCWDDWGDSNLVPFELTQGTTYSIRISDFFNMSYLKHFESYTKAGGKEAVNRANIAALKVMKM